jgi:hypothetical protein
VRHTGNHLAAQTGASTRELMQRMGHSTMRAALIYQHATESRARALAERLDVLVKAERDTAPEDDGAGGRQLAMRRSLHVRCTQGVPGPQNRSPDPAAYRL